MPGRGFMSAPTSISKRPLMDDRKDETGETIRRVKELQQEVTTLENQIAELEKKIASTPGFLRSFGRQFGFGAAGKIDWVRFKLRFMREELARFEPALPM